MTLEEMYGNAKALVEDRTYNIGEISEKTGLQKTANGWVKPKSNKKESVKSEQINKTWSKSDVVKSVPNGWKKAEGVTTVPNGYVAITNGGSLYPKEGQTKRETKIIKEEDFKNDEFYENPYALSKEEKNEAMKNPKTRLSQKYDEVIKSKKGTPQYNTALEEYTKERESYENSQGVEALKEFPVVPISKDSACRITADTKIRLKKKLIIDRVYQIGEKSEKTGKIKVANGKWVDPKKVKNTTKEVDNKSMRIKNGLKKTEEITDYLSGKLEKMGFKTKTDYSGLSGSQYITITNYSEMTGKESDYNGEELKIRISNHDLPPSYDGVHGYHDIDIMSEGKERPGNDGNATYYENVINKLNEQISKTKKEEIKKTKENTSKENKIAAESLPDWLLEEKSLRERLNNTSDINTRFVLMTFANYDKKERAKKIQNAIEATKNDKNSSYYQVFKEIGLI